MDVLRTGRISSINYKTGMARVVYEDRDDVVTDEMPLLLFGFVYWMPRVGDPVLVAHMGNGLENGVILGRYYCAENVPPEGKKDFYRMEFNRIQNCFIRHQENEIIELYAPKGIKLFCPEKGLEVIATDEGVRVDAEKGGVNINAKDGGIQIDATSGGVSIKGDTTIDGNLHVTKTTTSDLTIFGNGGMTIAGGSAGGATATITGTIQQISGDYKTTGNVNAQQDVTAGSISLKSHTHGGIQPGSSNTGTPQ